MNVLIVGEDATSSDLMNEILNENGHHVDIVETGEKAITELNNNQIFDFIITEINMPVVDGFMFLKYIKSKPRFDKIPILMASTVTDKESIIRSIELGAADYIVKPINKEMFLVKVKNIINKLPKSVLVVDDDKMILELLQKVIERQGYKTLIATSGEEALKLLDKHNVGIVISDIEMPSMSGMELLSQIKKTYNELPVLMITGKNNSHTKFNIKESKADGIIKKPFKNYEITQRISSLIK